MWKRGRASRGTRGAAAVEFALIMPILLLLVFGVISYGYMLSFRQAMSQAAAEGARAAAVAQSDGVRADKARDAVNEALESYGVTCEGLALKRGGVTVGSCTITGKADCDNDDEVDCATIRLSYAYKDHALIPVPLVNGLTLPENLEYTAVARVS